MHRPRGAPGAARPPRGYQVLSEPLRALRRQPGAALRLAAWSVPELAPAALSGFAVARAVDAGFLAHRPAVALAWLGALAAAGAVGAIGARQSFRCLGAIVEPFRDDLVRRVVTNALARSTATGGRPDTAAVARLTHQVELVRDTYAGLLTVAQGFAVSAGGALAGLCALAPVLLLFVLPPLALGLGLFLAAFGRAASRQRAYVVAGERLAGSAGTVVGGLRDIVACGAEDQAARMVGDRVDEQARAERALARTRAVRTLSIGLGGWLPAVFLLAGSPWLLSHGLGAGAIMGALLYVLQGLHPALTTLVSGVGGGGLRFVVTLGRILEACPDEPTRVDGSPPASGPVAGTVRGSTAGSTAGSSNVRLSDVTFAYGPDSEPVIRGLSLSIPAGDHLAVVGPSGIGKSTLAGLITGMIAPNAGQVRLGGVPVADLADRAHHRVLIPQAAYVFTGTLWENLAYLRLDLTEEEVGRAVDLLGAGPLVARVGGYHAGIRPDTLSAGQRQMIALVRAYLSPAPLAVLDEATCHLDPAAEARAEAAFARRGGTLVVIAHRLSSAMRARRILVLDGARTMLGDHESLLGRSWLYRDLVGHWLGVAPAADLLPRLALEQRSPAAVPVTPTGPPTASPSAGRSGSPRSGYGRRSW
jgi:ATP-binding cassette subfamily C protein